MYYILIDNAIFEDENLTHTEFRVLTYLIRNHDSDLGYSFPTKKLMIEKCNMSKDTLNKVLNSLEYRGYITRQTNTLKSGRNNIYYIHKYLLMPSEKEEVITEENVGESTVDEVIKYAEETEELIRKYYACEISAPEQTEEEKLKEKIDMFQVHLNREISSKLKGIIKNLDWDEIVKADTQICQNKKEDHCTETYIINAIYDNKKINLRLVK